MSRVCEHFAKVTYSRLDTDLGKHFCTPPHKGIDVIKISILEFIRCHPQSLTAERLRNHLESNWIHKLMRIAPQGLNLRDSDRARESLTTCGVRSTSTPSRGDFFPSSPHACYVGLLYYVPTISSQFRLMSLRIKLNTLMSGGYPTYAEVLHLSKGAI